MEKETAFKHMIGPGSIETIAQVLTDLYPEFPSREFRTRAEEGLDALELKDRVRQIIQVLSTSLPPSFPDAAAILRRLPETWDPDNAFIAWPLVDYVGEYGLDHPEVSLEVLKTLTPLFSAEFAIRPFLVDHEELTLKTIALWTSDPSEHVRRLVSEGTRPRLPWGIRLRKFIEDPTPILGLLEELKDDESEYVRRSVANNLNDIAKDHVDVVLDICRRWIDGADTNRERLVAHACRTLVKRGDPRVFPLLGYDENPDLHLGRIEWPEKGVAIGDPATFLVELHNTTNRTQRVVVDFSIHYRKAKGGTSPKVFKMGNVTLEPGARKQLKKSVSFADKMIRTHYPGEHGFALQINGTVVAERQFDLRPED